MNSVHHSRLIHSLPLAHRYPRGLTVYPNAPRAFVFTIHASTLQRVHQSRPPLRRAHATDSISSQNFFRSKFPPDTTHTIGPLPALPVRAAASDSAPAPSEMTRTFSAIRRIAFFVSSSVTTMLPSTTGFIRSHMRGKMLCPPAPSTNDAGQFV